MDLEKLQVGMIVKNYKELCSVLNIECRSTGNSRNYQLKDMERYFKYHKQGQKFIIDEIYEIPKDKIETRGGGNKGKFKKFDNLLIRECDYNKIGVYKITLNKDIYIGSTIKGFRERYQEHTYKDHNLPTRDMLLNGAVFEILEICEDATEPQIRQKENEYIGFYKNHHQFNIVNDRNAWSYTEPNEKIKYKTIRIKESNYDNAIHLLKENKLF